MHQDFLLSVNINEEPILRDTIPGYPGVHVHPLFLGEENGIWVLYAKFDPNIELPKHFHTGTVHFFTTKGSWQYVEYPDDVQTAGSYLYEPGGSTHTFKTTDEGAEGFMAVFGANINFLPDGSFMNIMDAGWIESLLEPAAKAGGHAMPRYIKPGGGAQFTKK